MADYRTIKPSFWTDEYIAGLSSEGKLLYVFLFSNPFAVDNNLGITQANAVLLSALTGIDVKTVENQLAIFEQDKKIIRADGKILLINFIRCQTSTSPKIIQGLKNDYNREQSASLKAALSITYPDIFPSADTLSIPYPYPMNTLPIHKEMEMEREREIEREMEPEGEREEEIKNKGDNAALVDGKPPTSSGKVVPDCPHREIIALYHEILPELPKVRCWEGERVKMLKARWRSAPDTQSLDWWREYFERVRASDFLMGRVTSRTTGKPFYCTLEWLIKPENFAKVNNGAYDPRASTATGNAAEIGIAELRRQQAKKYEQNTERSEAVDV